MPYEIIYQGKPSYDQIKVLVAYAMLKAKSEGVINLHHEVDVVSL